MNRFAFGFFSRRLVYAARAFIFAGLGAAALHSAWGAKCESDSSRYHIMPREIGSENESLKSPYALPCDSMIVPAGQTTTINEYSMLHFGPNPPVTAKIVVKGTLIIKGKPDRPVSFSGTVLPTHPGYLPGEAKWDGITVDSGGMVRSDYAKIINAPTAMVIQSRNVAMFNTMLQGVAGVVLPDSYISVGSNGTTIDTIDLRLKKNATVGKAKPGASKTSRSDPSPTATTSVSGKSVALYTLAGTALIAAGGAAFWMMHSGGEPTPQPRPQVETPIQPDPAFPNNVLSR